MTAKPAYNAALALEALKDGNDYCPKLITRSIRTNEKRAATWQIDIHAIACSLLSRSDAHNDCSLVPAHLLSMPNGTRRKAMIGWYHAFGNVTITTSAKGEIKARMVSKTSADYKIVDHGRAFMTPFHSVEEKAPDKGAFNDLTIMTRVASLIKAATDDAADVTDPVSLAFIADMKVFMATRNAALEAAKPAIAPVAPTADAVDPLEAALS